MIDGRFSIRAIALVAVAVFALAAGACGSDDDGDGAGDGAGDRASETGADFEKSSDFAATGSDEQQIEQVLDGIQADFVNVDGAAYCDKVIPAERREIEAFGRNYRHGTTCVGVVNNLARETNKTGVKQNPTKLLSVRVNGSRATAKVSNGGRPPEPLAFRKMGGEWKLVESGFEPDPLVAAKKEEARKKAERKRRLQQQQQ